MFGNHIQAVDLMKTYYFTTGPEIAGRLCVSSVCMPVYLYLRVWEGLHLCMCMCVCVSLCSYYFQVSPEIAVGLLSQVLYV